MRNPILLLLLLASGALAGCQHAMSEQSAPQRELNARLVTSLSDEALRNAIVRQHTLFPYHFVPESFELNDLGKHDLILLADFYRQHPGLPLSIRRGDASAGLYAARRRTVQEFLALHDVKSATLKIRDTPPGGDGMASEQVYMRFIGAEQQAAPRPAGSQPQTFKVESFTAGD